MRRIILLILIAGMFIMPVNAMDFTAPEAPDVAKEYIPENSQSFAEDLWYVIKIAISKLQPGLAEASGVCLSLIAIVLLTSLLQNINSSAHHTVQLAGTLGIGIALFLPANSMIALGAETVSRLCEYGKMLLPVLTTALAAQGGTSSSAALYAGTAAFNAILSTLISRIIVPMIYIYLCLCIACSMVGQNMLKNLRDFIKWAMTWCLKTILYIFTGYLGVTKVISGSVDASAMKATKLAISGAVPVVGGLISDATESILVSAGLVKSAVGSYGLIAIWAIWIGPFLQIGCQYLMLKITASVCGVIGSKESTALISDFTGAMGMLLAMTGTVCLLLLVSTVCFMKGVG